jgi:hypothetical protein
VAELQSGHTNFVGGEAIKHECVIGVWAVGHRDFTNWRRYCTHLFASKSFIINTSVLVIPYVIPFPA